MSKKDKNSSYFMVRKMQTTAGGPLKLRFTPEQIASFENQTIRILGMLSKPIQLLAKLFERIAIKDATRKYIFQNRKMGTYTPYKVGNEWKWDANGKSFGRQIAEGSEQDVYQNLHNSNEVLKILSQSYPTKSAMRKGVQIYNKRNLVPMQERSKFVGYMKGVDAATRIKPAYYPVFSQKKLTIPADQSFSTWDNTLLPELEKLMRKNGITVKDHSYSYGKYSIGDLSPANVGVDEMGNWKFVDAYVE